MARKNLITEKLKINGFNQSSNLRFLGTKRSVLAFRGNNEDGNFDQL